MKMKLKMKNIYGQTHNHMKNNLLTIIFLLFSSGIFSQGVYNNGGKIVIGSGVTMYINGTGGNYRNETNVTNGSMDLNGTLTIQGNITNNVAVTDILSTVGGSSAVILNGTASQTLGGTTTSSFTFNNLTVNNSGGIVLDKNALVNGTMTFTSGLLNIGNNNFTFGPASVSAGTPSAASMIVATGTGQVMKNWSAAGSFTFPVGDNNLTAKYSPVSLNFTTGTFAVGAYTGLNLVNSNFNDPSITGTYLNRYWNISQTGITSFTCNAMFQYLPADVVGTEASIYTLRVLPAPFSTFDPANATLHQLTANGLTSFGTFTGGPGFKTLTLSSIMLQGLYSAAGTMRQAWDAVGPHFAAGVADQINVELHNSTTYATVAYTASNVPLSTAGAATITIPVANNGSYYITIRHRNSLETTTAVPVSFASGTISQSYGLPANVFGGNMALSTDGHYLIFGGDVNQDGVIDTRDYIGVDNDSFNFASGYIVTDVNGDGVIDTRDFIIIDNNNFNFIGTSHP